MKGRKAVRLRSSQKEDRKLRSVLILRSFAEAQVIEARLAEQQIPALVRSFNDPAFGSFWRRGEGWGEVLAFEEDAEEIRRICGEPPPEEP